MKPAERKEISRKPAKTGQEIVEVKKLQEEGAIPRQHVSHEIPENADFTTKSKAFWLNKLKEPEKFFFYLDGKGSFLEQVGNDMELLFEQLEPILEKEEKPTEDDPYPGARDAACALCRADSLLNAAAGDRSDKNSLENRLNFAFEAGALYMAAKSILFSERDAIHGNRSKKGAGGQRKRQESSIKEKLNNAWRDFREDNPNGVTKDEFLNWLKTEGPEIYELDVEYDDSIHYRAANKKWSWGYAKKHLKKI